MMLVSPTLSYESKSQVVALAPKFMLHAFALACQQLEYKKR